MTLKEALMSMDSIDDSVWTQDGAPRLEALSEMTGFKISRQDVTEVAPGFSRENMVVLEDITLEDDQEADPEAGEEVILKDDPEAGEDMLADYVGNGKLLSLEEFTVFLKSLPGTSLEDFSSILSSQMEMADKNIVEVMEAKNLLAQSRRLVLDRKQVEFPDMTEQQAIQEFIKSQTAQRQSRAMRSREILKGVDAKELDPRSPIDRAMARKNNRGTSRPVRELME